MSEKHSGVNWVKNPRIRERRIKVWDRLLVQLQKGTKASVDPETGYNIASPLTEHDITRINREIETLKTRI